MDDWTGWSCFFYDTVGQWGLQDPRELIDPVIVEVNRGIGLVYMLTMIPIFIIAAIVYAVFRLANVTF